MKYQDCFESSLSLFFFCFLSPLSGVRFVVFLIESVQVIDGSRKNRGRNQPELLRDRMCGNS